MTSFQNKALATHHKVTHLERRDFVCPHGECQATFGYKHLLQRHLAKIHPASDRSESNSGSDPSEDSSLDVEDSGPGSHPEKRNAIVDMSIDAITGASYAVRARQKLQGSRALSCPFPNLHGISLASEAEAEISTASTFDGPNCDYVFSRAYDLRRHLRAQHGIETDKSSVEEWVARGKRARRTS